MEREPVIKRRVRIVPRLETTHINDQVAIKTKSDAVDLGKLEKRRMAPLVKQV